MIMSDIEPLVSVVMPVYNSELFLAEAIDSILNQTLKNFEFLIVYDESKDSTYTILDRYNKSDSRIKIIYGQNEGLIGALNKGFKYARGKYIARMDADDISLPNRLAKQVALLEMENADVCGCHYALVDPNNRIIQYISMPVTASSVLLYSCYRTPFPHPGVMIKKNSMTEKSLLYGTSLFSAIEDYDLWVRMIFAGLILMNVDDVLLRYRIHTGSISQQKKNFIRRESNDLSDLIFIRSHEKLQNCFHALIKQEIMPNADIEAAINYAFLEIIHKLSFKEARLLLNKFGYVRFIQLLLPTIFRRIVAIKDRLKK